MKIEEAKTFLDNLKVCVEEHPIVADWLVEIADRKTENSSEKPNNCDEPSDECKKCKHLKHISNYGWDCEFEFFEDCNYEPKDEPQTDCAWK